MFISDEQFSQFRPQFRRLVAAWQVRVPWLEAMGIGPKITGGEVLDEDAVTFFVGSKIVEAGLESTELVPESIAIPQTNIVLPTDVVAMPPLRFLTVPVCSSNRPAHGGECISPFGSASIGTLGAVLKRKADGNRFILSASHAIVGIGGTLPVGQKICHPPGGSDVIGTVSRTSTWTTLDFMSADAGLVEVTNNDDVDANVNGIGILSEPGTPNLHDSVRFSGVNGVKIGIVTWTAKIIAFVEDVFGFENTFFIDAVAEPADSGSVVVNIAGEVLGVVFAGNGILTACSHIAAVSKELGLSDYDF
jgi:hypothetical protein